MTAFASMFLIKVAIKYGGDLVERDRVYDLTTSLVRRFRSIPAGKWHLPNLMAGGLERMTETLKTAAPGQVPPLINGVGMATGIDETLEPMAQPATGERPFTDLDGDLFFDYDMSFGLSPVFRFDPGMLNIDGSAPMPNYPEPDYGVRAPL